MPQRTGHVVQKSIIISNYGMSSGVGYMTTFADLWIMTPGVYINYHRFYSKGDRKNHDLTNTVIITKMWGDLIKYLTQNYRPLPYFRIS